MNVGNIAENAASNAASNASLNASGAFANTATNTVNGTSALAPKTLPKEDNITQFPGNSNPPKNNSNLNADNVVDFPQNQNNEDTLGNIESHDNPPEKIEGEQKNKTQDENTYHAQSNQNVEPGKKIDEEGNVVNTGSRKAVEAIGRGVAAYATGGESIGKEDMITKNQIGDKALGVVADKIDKTPIAGEVLNDLGDSGLADGVNDTLDTVGKLKNGDIKGAAESAKKAKKDIKKVKKKYGPKIILALFSSLFPIFMSCIVIIIICGPIIGGFMDVTNALGEFADNVGDFFSGENSIESPIGGDNIAENLAKTEQLLIDVPNYSSLSSVRQSIVAAAASGIASGRPYHIRSGDNDPCTGKPTGPGLDGIPACGVDCSGFVQWSLWTATGSSPFSGGTSTMAASIGGIFEEISESELQPGDIGLKHKNSGNNHTGIYAGNGMWYHAANSKTGIVRSKYTGFTVFLRYKGVD